VCGLPASAGAFPGHSPDLGLEESQESLSLPVGAEIEVDHDVVRVAGGALDALRPHACLAPDLGEPCECRTLRAEVGDRVLDVQRRHHCLPESWVINVGFGCRPAGLAGRLSGRDLQLGAARTRRDPRRQRDERAGGPGVVPVGGRDGDSGGEAAERVEDDTADHDLITGRGPGDGAAVSGGALPAVAAI